MRPTLEQRLLNKTNKTDACWLWIGSLNNKGYGQIGVSHNKTAYTHRVSYTLFVGEIPKGLNVLHKCDRPSCLNPKHLFLGTQKDNMQDWKRKGRTTLGSKARGYVDGRYADNPKEYARLAAARRREEDVGQKKWKAYYAANREHILKMGRERYRLKKQAEEEAIQLGRLL